MASVRDIKPDEEWYQACLNGDTAAVRRLLDTRSATDQIYGYAHVPLYLACFGGHRETVSLLSERGANFSARCARPGNAPLTGAASGGHVALIRLCLERGAEIDGRPESPDPRFNCTDTPLIAACRRLHLDSARVLLELGANVDEAGNNSDTPLHRVQIQPRRSCALAHNSRRRSWPATLDDNGRGSLQFVSTQMGD